MLHDPAALEAPGFKAVLDKEVDKCDLLCHNCHHRKTWGYLAARVKRCVR